MFLFETLGFAYTCIFLASFILCYFIILFSNLEKLFKQGAIWPIRLAQIVVAFILAYFIAQGIYALIEAAM